MEEMNTSEYLTHKNQSTKSRQHIKYSPLKHTLQIKGQQLANIILPATLTWYLKELPDLY